MYVVAKRLDGLRCHLVWRQAAAQSTLCSMGTELTPEKKAHHPHPHQFYGSCLLWPNGWMDQDDTWYRGKPRPRQRCVRWGRSPPQKGHCPQFSVHVYCGQTLGWMKTPLGTEVDICPGHIVWTGTQLLRERAQQPPLFGPCVLWPRSPISATAELLLNISVKTALESVYFSRSYR